MTLAVGQDLTPKFEFESLHEVFQTFKKVVLNIKHNLSFVESH